MTEDGPQGLKPFLAAATPEARSRIAELMDQGGPLLVEVRFPRMGTSSDWYLCMEVEEITAILDRVAPNVELHLTSVWDIDDLPSTLRVKK